MTAKETKSNSYFENYVGYTETPSHRLPMQARVEAFQLVGPLYSATESTVASSNNGTFRPQKPRSLSLPSISRPNGLFTPRSPVVFNTQHEPCIFNSIESSPAESSPPGRSSTACSSRSSNSRELQVMTPSPVSSSLDEFPFSPITDKGKGRPVEVLGTEGGDIILLEDAIGTPIRDLDDMDKDEISRRDEELALSMLVEDLRSEGCTDAEIQHYLVKLKVLSAQSADKNFHSSPLPSIECAPPGLASPIPDKNQIVDSTMNAFASRRVPPAYGPDYTPEASTSSTGSPELVSRRLSVSSRSGTNRVSAGGDPPQASLGLSFTDQLGQIELDMERRLEEVLERHRREILYEWNEIKASFHREMRKEDTRRRRHERVVDSEYGHGPHFVPLSPDGGGGSHVPNRGQDSSNRKYGSSWFPHLGF